MDSKGQPVPDLDSAVLDPDLSQPKIPRPGMSGLLVTNPWAGPAGQKIYRCPFQAMAE